MCKVKVMAEVADVAPRVGEQYLLRNGQGDVVAFMQPMFDSGGYVSRELRYLLDTNEPPADVLLTEPEEDTVASQTTQPLPLQDYRNTAAPRQRVVFAEPEETEEREVVLIRQQPTRREFATDIRKSNGDWEGKWLRQQTRRFYTRIPWEEEETVLRRLDLSQEARSHAWAARQDWMDGRLQARMVRRMRNMLAQWIDVSIGTKPFFEATAISPVSMNNLLDLEATVPRQRKLVRLQGFQSPNGWQAF